MGFQQKVPQEFQEVGDHRKPISPIKQAIANTEEIYYANFSIIISGITLQPKYYEIYLNICLLVSVQGLDNEPSCLISCSRR